MRAPSEDFMESRRMPEIDVFRRMGIEARVEFLYCEVVRLYAENSSLRRDVLKQGRQPRQTDTVPRRKRGRRTNQAAVGEQSS